MDAQDQNPDLIDEALADLVDQMINADSIEDDDVYDDAFEDAWDYLADEMDDLIDAGTIPEMPDLEASQDEQKAWLDQALPLLRQTALGHDENEPDSNLE